MDKVLEITKELLRHMKVSFDSVEVSLHKETNSPILSIKTQESGILIGTQGENFIALSHIIKKIASKYIPEETDFSLDVNDYQEKLIAKLTQKALILADRARSFKTPIEMEPASSYERRIVHTLFTNTPDIKTESQGLGALRHVVIKWSEDKAKI